ncbi:MAG: serine/threonine-protein kinase, partial [Myxococcota bacterium]
MLRCAALRGAAWRCVGPLELVKGQTLRDWMRQDPPPDWRTCVEVFIQVGQGLAAAHKQDLVHRDFKPGNAIIDDEGRPRVLDFGLARQVHTDLADEDDEPSILERLRIETDDPALGTPLTRTGAVLGTPAYMPPEQMKGREADARSDQFSFCVSFYEAVYGERPFEGTTMVGLIVSMMGDAVRPAPKGSPVPARLRTLLLRGLAHEPAARWPSMDALLNELRTLMAPTRRWLARGLTIGLVGLGGVVAVPQYLAFRERCTGAQAEMEGVWDDTRRGQVQAAVLGTEVSFAPSTWERVEPRLDAYADAWMRTHTETCEATSVRGEQSEEALDLRMRCLGQRRTALRATVDELVDADAKVVEKAVELVAGLPTLTRCDDLDWLEQHNQLVPPPEDPAVAAAVEVQRAHLADIEVMDNAGRYAEALDEIEPVVQQSKSLRYPPLRAEALYWRGKLQNRNGQYHEAEQDLRQAHMLAVELHHDPVALHTAQAMTGVVGGRLARHLEGQHWGEINALPLAERSGEPVEKATSLSHLGSVFISQGDYEKERLFLQQALAIKEKALGI